MPSSRVLYWFRTDLRISDSPALCASLSLGDIEAFYPVWCWDPSYIYGHRVGLNRWSFLLESMISLSSELTRLNREQKLLVVRSKPQEILPVLWKEWGITHVVWEKDSNAYSKIRDEEIIRLANINGVQVVCVHGRHLYDPEKVGEGYGNKPTLTLHAWQTVTSKMGKVPKPSPTPTTLPDPGITTLPQAKDKFKWEGLDMNSHIRTGHDTCYDHILGPNHDFSIPTMSQMGYSSSTTSIRGGTIQAHQCLSNFLRDPRKVATFSKPASSPTSLEPSTTLLSPYLKFGCVGVREVWWGCKDVIETYTGGGITKEPENMFGQLQFRDMYASAEAATRHFERIRGNHVSRYIDWGLQNQYDPSGHEILPRPRGDLVDEERFEAWKEGRTGFPWIDACMRQLKYEGWIHHLARHSVACYLTRGQCYISWERGMEVFDEWLIDWDPASNPGNWMWLSCSAFFSQYYRVYGLVSWPQKTDKTGQLVRKYCPELKGFPDKYIYAPHLAPESVQRQANCIIGIDYPSPSLDERTEKDRCIARLKNAFALNLHGDAAEVLDGTAAGMFRAKHAESGVSEIKEMSEKERKREEGEKRRKRSGDASLEGFFKRKKVDGGHDKGKGKEKDEEDDDVDRDVGMGEIVKGGKKKKETIQGEA
ncbi:FAD binding domain of DNA photolyase-domain-containing protein [Naematelia encephala]|uniref:FAD binding domain of DNA photolyase-domain-containing protein n=1 Tax=Naematelia encephala TaxID=71784 RepID=A0A1Y2BAU2_9TREE|nr:FAD binding domain of DNA photolyase-domain-containing protein [Naematelia encephala]